MAFGGPVTGLKFLLVRIVSRKKAIRGGNVMGEGRRFSDFAMSAGAGLPFEKSLSLKAKRHPPVQSGMRLASRLFLWIFLI